MENIYLLILAGAFGAIAKEILENGCIKLPKILNGKLDLGFLGGMFIGGLVGAIIDGSYTTAAMAGFVGFTAIENILPAKILDPDIKITPIEQVIRKIAKEEAVDPDLVIRIAKCESSLNPKAVNINSPESIDRGLFQINSKYHPEVLEAEAFDPEFATRFFCKAFKNGNLNWWYASKKCWDLT